jgi:hypothetical protein
VPPEAGAVLPQPQLPPYEGAPLAPGASGGLAFLYGARLLGPCRRRTRAFGPRHLPLLAHIASSQFSSRAAPASPDFSGWNCVALTRPSSTAATKRSPCSAVETSPDVGPRTA